MAGSERLKKTLNIGDRLREAQNINTSLLVLGRCLKSIHEGQLTRTKNDAVGPFRESKLTRLFQRALSGKEHLALIVNVNPLPNLYIETQNVLNFAAIAKRIVTEKKKQIRKKFKSRFSQIVTQSRETVTDWDATELESVDWQHTDTAESASEYVTSEEYMDLANENEKLRKEIVALKSSALVRDFQNRQEMAEKYIAMINELEVDWKQRINDVESQHEDDLEWTVKQIEDFYKGKLNRMHKKKRSRVCYSDESGEEDNDYLDATVKELTRENMQLRGKNDSLKKTLTEMKITNETLTIEKNKVSFELGLSKEELKVARNLLEAAEKDLSLSQDGAVYMKEMTSQLLTKDEQIKKLKEILNEAKEEYISTTSDLRNKELRIDEQANLIIENEERIEDLELQLEQVNVCLTEKTEMVERLEEKLECRIEQLSDAESKILQMQREIDRLKDEKLALIRDKRDSSRRESETTRGETSAPSLEYQEIIIKEEIITTVEDCGVVPEDLHPTTQKDNLDPVDRVSRVAKEHLESSPPIMVEVGCQVDGKDDDENYDQLEGIGCCESTQTATATATTETVESVATSRSNGGVSSKEEAVQTSETFDSDCDKLKKLEQLTMRYDDVRAQYQQECLKVERLMQQFDDMRQTTRSLTEENSSVKTAADEYKHSAEILERQLSLAAEEKRKMEESLLGCNVALERKISDYEREMDRLRTDLSAAEDHARRYLDKLKTGEEARLASSLKCDKNARKSDESTIPTVEENDALCDVDVIKTGQPDQRGDKMDTDLEMARLKRDIVELNENLEACQREKSRIEDALDENSKQLLKLESRLEGTALREREKDIEIATLQKELKRVIHGGQDSKKNQDLMEAELKVTKSELKQRKEELSRKEQYIEELKLHRENSERSAKMFSLLEVNAKERQIENERLRNINDELRSNLTYKEREMDSFVKNRDETMSKYEALVKNQQEELEMQKREVVRYQELFRRQVTPTPKDDCKSLQNRIQDLQDKLRKYEVGARDKDYCDTTSEDEISSQRQPKRRGKKTMVSSSTKREEEISVVVLSGSESKRSTRRTAQPGAGGAASAAVVESSTSANKRTTRRKKLFVANDSLADIEPEPAPSTTVPPSTRNLRNRKK